jgi:hypothetical protein
MVIMLTFLALVYILERRRHLRLIEESLVETGLCYSGIRSVSFDRKRQGMGYRFGKT